MGEDKLVEQVNVKITSEEKRDILEICNRFNLGQSEFGRIAIKLLLKDIASGDLLRLLGRSLEAL